MHDASIRDEGNARQHGRFAISIDLIAAEAIIGVAGEIDAATAPELDAIAVKLCEQRHPTVVFNLAHIDFIDAAGLRVISRTARRLHEQGGQLRLRSPSPF